MLFKPDLTLMRKNSCHKDYNVDPQRPKGRRKCLVNDLNKVHLNLFRLNKAPTGVYLHVP